VNPIALPLTRDVATARKGRKGQFITSKKKQVEIKYGITRKIANGCMTRHVLTTTAEGVEHEIIKVTVDTTKQDVIMSEI